MSPRKIDLGLASAVLLLSLADGVQLRAQTPVAPDAPVEVFRSIGVAMGAEEFEFTLITDVQFLPGQTLAVADVGAPYVRIFGVDGEHLATLGRRGSGRRDGGRRDADRKGRASHRGRRDPPRTAARVVIVRPQTSSLSGTERMCSVILFRMPEGSLWITS
jgi:hypothetical protein